MNIFGLAVGMACFVLAALWLNYEWSFDRFHVQRNRIFQILAKSKNNELNSDLSLRLGPILKKNCLEITDYCRIRFKNASLIQHENLRFHEQSFYLADSSLFKIFTFPFIYGNPDTALAETNSIVLTEATAQKYFGSEDPMGKTLRVLQFDADFTVTGVIEKIPPNSRLRFDLVAGIEWMGPERLESWEPSSATFVLLSSQATPQEVVPKINNLIKELKEPVSFSDLALQPLTRMFQEGSQPAGSLKQVYVYSIIAVFVLLLACINFINLSTAGSIKRAKEIGVRKITGASRKQLLVQCLCESTLLSLLAFFLALVIVQISLPAVNQLLAKEFSLVGLSRSYLLLIVLAIIPVTGILAGSYPAIFLSSFAPVHMLKGKFNPNFKGLLFRKILITFQFSVSIGLIICSLTILKQLRLFKATSPGINQNSIIEITCDKEFFTRFSAFKEALLENSEILNVTAASNRPAQVRDEVFIRPSDQSEENSILAAFNMVDFDFFETFEMELVQGRSFQRAAPEDRTHSCVVNESALRKLGIDAPIGKQVYFDHTDFAKDYNTLRIIGVVKDFHYRSLHQAVGPFVFRFHRPWHFRIYIKILPGKFPTTLVHIEKVYKKYAPNYPFYFEFLDDTFNELYKSEIQLGKLFGVFGIITILISSIGLYGLASYSAELRIKEIGIRKVMGASTTGLVVALTKQFAATVLMANVYIWPVAYLVMESWLKQYATRAHIGLDVLFFAALITQTVAIGTVSIRALKTAAANPVEALRFR